MFSTIPSGARVRDGKYFFEKSASQKNLAHLSNLYWTLTLTFPLKKEQTHNFPVQRDAREY